MFMRKKTLKKLLKDMLGKGNDEIVGLLAEAKSLIGPAEDVSRLKQEIAELGLKKTMEQREIEHLVKIKEEKLSLEHQKKEVELQRQFQEKEMKLRENYNEKIMKSIGDFQIRQDKFFEQVMTRLPDVKVLLGETAKKKAREK